MLCLLFKHSLKQSILIDPLFRKFYLTFFRYSADTGENGNRVSDRAEAPKVHPSAVMSAIRFLPSAKHPEAFFFYT